MRWATSSTRYNPALTAAALTAAALFTELALAQPTISVERLFIGTTHVRAVVRIVNGDQRAYRVIGILCTFFHRGAAVDSAGSVSVNVAAGDTVFENLIGPDKSQPVSSAQCRISYANP